MWKASPKAHHQTYILAAIFSNEGRLNLIMPVFLYHLNFDLVSYYPVCSYNKGNIRDANFSICQVVMIAEDNRRMPKAFVGGSRMHEN